MKPLVLNAAIAMILAALLTVSLWPSFEAFATPEDEAIPLVYPEMFMKGRYPYRDFETIYGPGNLLVFSATYSIFGISIFVERAVGLVYRLAIMLALFAIATRWGSVVALGTGLIAAVLLGGMGLFADTWLAALAFVLLGLCLTDPASRSRSFAGGAFAGVAALCRCDLGPAIVVAFLPLFLFMKPKTRASFLAGGALGLAPLLWFAVVVGPAQLVHSLFIFPVFELSGSAYFPFSTAAPELRRLFYFFVAANLTNLVAAIIALKRGDKADARLLLGAALLGAVPIYYALSRFDDSHAINAAIIAVSLLPVSLSVIFSAIAKLPTAVLNWAASGVAIAALPLIVPWYVALYYHEIQRQIAPASVSLRPGDKGWFVEHDGRVFPLLNENTAISTTNMLKELSRVGTPGQRVLVGPGDFRRTVGADTFLYHLLPRFTPGTYYLEMNPGSTNAPGSRLAGEVANSDWLILDRGWDLIHEPNKSSEYGSDEPNQVVRQKFDFWGEFGPYVLLRNRRLRNSLQPLPEQQHQ